MSEKRYVKVPVTVEKNGDAGFLAWAETDKAYQYMSCCENVYGRGATEDEAFTDLLKKLGYEEVPTLEYGPATPLTVSPLTQEQIAVIEKFGAAPGALAITVSASVDIEALAEKMHDAMGEEWYYSHVPGFTTYASLPESAKDLLRAAVRAIIGGAP